MLNDELLRVKAKNGKIKNRLNEITVRLKHSDRHGKEDKHLEELLEKSKSQVNPHTFPPSPLSYLHHVKEENHHLGKTIEELDHDRPHWVD